MRVLVLEGSNLPDSRPGRTSLVLFYGLLMAVAGFSRLRGLSPPSLGLDDLWVALIIKHVTPTGLFTYQAPAPMGFIAASKPFQAMIEHPELGPQILPFLCGLALIPLSGWAASRLTNRWEVGVLAAVLVVLHPYSGLYPVRVKQFTWDAALTLTLLGAGLPQLDPRRRAKPWLLAGLAAVGLVASFNTIFAGAILLHLVAFQAILDQQLSSGATRRAVLAVLAYDAFALLFYYARLQGQSKDWLTLFWQNHGGFPPSVGIDLDYLGGALSRAYGRWLPRGWRVFTPLPALGILWLLCRRQHRWQGFALALLLLAFPIAGLLRIYPFGGVRTDYYFQPVLAITAAVAIAGVAAVACKLVSPASAGSARVLRRLIPVMTAALALLLMPFPKSHYGTGLGTSANKDLVLAMDEIVRSDDLVLLTPLSRSNVAYYTSRPLEIRFADPAANIYSMNLTDPESREFSKIPPLKTALEQRALPDRVVVIAIMTADWYVEWVERVFRKNGYRIEFTQQNAKGTSVLRLFVRTPSASSQPRRKKNAG